MRNCDSQQGFTLVELMVGLAVLAILTAAALPSFAAFRQRAAVREAADQAVAFWNTARFEAVKRNAGRARLEASGGITLATIRSIAETGVDRISVGALTHSAPALDIALDYQSE